jgi:hypothetical protein
MRRLRNPGSGLSGRGRAEKEEAGVRPASAFASCRRCYSDSPEFTSRLTPSLVPRRDDDRSPLRGLLDELPRWLDEPPLRELDVLDRDVDPLDCELEPLLLLPLLFSAMVSFLDLA